MRNNVRFHAKRFAPLDPEATRTNPGRHGEELATWVAATLQAQGIEVAPPAPEDWGWLLAARHRGDYFSIACGNVDGSMSDWLVAIELPRVGILARLLTRRGRPEGDVAEVVGILDNALQSDAGVSAVEWFRVGPRGQEIDHAPKPT
jgi:hypothetical protein